MYDDIALAIENQFPQLQATLEELIRMPSVSAAGYDAGEVRRSAEFTADLLRAAGFDNVHLLEHEGAHPAVYGEIAGPEGSPTVLLYAHHDVQPPGPDEEWHTAPFEPIVRDGRIYGRGSSDDASGIIVHLGAVGAFDGKPPVGVKVIIEGEEEIGSLHLEDFLAEHADMLAADVIVIADSGNWKTGQPSLTTSLRGLVDCTVEVRTLDNAVHSGMFGGTLPDAIISLARLIATLHNDDGSIAIPGLVHSDADPLDLTEADVRAWSGAVDGVELIGTGGLTARMWMQPAISVLAIDAPPTSEAINQLVPVARAKISMRLAPGDDPQRAMAALVDHLENHAPWGAQVTVIPGAAGEAFALDTTGPAYDAFRTGFRTAWDTEPNEIGVGGSIPFVAAFSERYPDATILLTGVADHLSRAHGPDESLDLDDLKKGTIAEAIALQVIARQ